MQVTIFGRPNCPYCDKAKNLLALLEESGHAQDSRYIDMHEHGITKADLQKTIGREVYTVPQVLIDGLHIGGFTEFEAHVNG